MATAPKSARTRKAASSASAGKSPTTEKTWRGEGKPILDKSIRKDFKDYKDNKEFKDYKDRKEFKDHKSEWKDYKDHKFEKHEKIEIKDNKNEKAEIDIQTKLVPEIVNPLGGTPGHPGDPIPDSVILEWAMSAGLGDAEHFIKPEDRPDLGEGALSEEGDRAKPKS